MRCYQITDTRDFMKKLLLEDVFDAFLLSEASITTFSYFQIEGTFHPEYFGVEEETEQYPYEKDGYVQWKRIRPFFYQLTKGKNPPSAMKLVFRLAQDNVDRLLRQSGLQLPLEQLNGLFLNIKYDENGLFCFSGISLTVFSLDKAPEYAWEQMLEKFFRQKKIAYIIS